MSGKPPGQETIGLAVNHGGEHRPLTLTAPGGRFRSHAPSIPLDIGLVDGLQYIL
ncbi:MAG: hypothetical protein M3509_09550 [Chloroflexota bacterium]|nr:hypothetical protein [Chloroflexota bacterium]